MIPIVTPDEMAAIDAAAPEPVEVLIARAGWAVARAARRMLGGTYGKRVVIIAGRGNNGNDGRVAGALLARRGVRVTVVDPLVESLPDSDLIIDAAFGTGLSRPYAAPKPSDPDVPVLAVDIPSGVSGFTGEVLGTPLAARQTVTFAALKPGLVCGDGAALAGHVDVVDIGLDVSSARAWKVTGQDVAAWLPVRPHDDHKWRAALRLVAGSPGMTGAADLATAAAFRTGAGYVRRSTPGVDPAKSGVATTGPIEAVSVAMPIDDWADDVLVDIDRFGALALGPGLGRARSVAVQVAALVDAPLPVVIDGDGLRALGDDPAGVLSARRSDAPPVVLTPHDGEFAGLGGDAENPDRFAAGRALAAQTNAVVLRKGPTTIIAHPDGRILVCDVGDARLATAGSGDVLTGILGALLARRVEPFCAAAAAAWIHGAAARLGSATGLTASDLPDLVSRLFQSIQPESSA